MKKTVSPPGYNARNASSVDPFYAAHDFTCAILDTGPGQSLEKLT
jgi:hypothetical protein